MSISLRHYLRGYDLVAMTAAANSKSYYHFDYQGTTQLLTDQVGTVKDRFSSDAWGFRTTRHQDGINRNWYIGNLGYHESRDHRTQYVRAREYDPSTACWLSVDPSSTRLPNSSYAEALAIRWFGQSSVPDTYTDFPKYVYCDNSPSVRVDPSGKISIGATGYCEPNNTSIVTGVCTAINAFSLPANLWSFMSGAICGCVDSANHSMQAHPNRSNNANHCPCDPSKIPELFDCLKSICTDPSNTVNCASPCAPISGRSPCGSSTHTSNGKNCSITMCSSRLATGCRDNGDNTINPWAMTFLHEAGHCCGIEDSKYNQSALQPGWDCNDIFACCLYNMALRWPAFGHRQGGSCNRV